MKVRLLLSVLAIALTFASCSKDNDSKEEKKISKGTQVKNLYTFNKDNWVYFSFKKGVITIQDPENSLDWDIAFFAHYLKTNGGISGKGEGGAIKTDSNNFDTVTSAPTEGYTQDVNGTMSYGSYPNLTKKEGTFSQIVSGDFETKTGYVSLSPNNIGKWPSVYAPTKYVYIIKTAKGEYAKFQVTDFYNDGAKPNYVTFSYLISKDGKF